MVWGHRLEKKSGRASQASTIIFLYFVMGGCSAIIATEMKLGHTLFLFAPSPYFPLLLPPISFTPSPKSFSLLSQRALSIPALFIFCFQKSVWKLLKKLLHVSAVPLLGTWPKGSKSTCHTGICISTFIMATFAIARIGSGFNVHQQVTNFQTCRHDGILFHHKEE